MPPTSRIIGRHSSAPNLDEEEEANNHRNLDLIAAESKSLKVTNHHAECHAHAYIIYSEYGYIGLVESFDAIPFPISTTVVVPPSFVAEM